MSGAVNGLVKSCRLGEVVQEGQITTTSPDLAPNCGICIANWPKFA